VDLKSGFKVAGWDVFRFLGMPSVAVAGAMMRRRGLLRRA
jgi:hypothetical protein